MLADVATLAPAFVVQDLKTALALMVQVGTVALACRDERELACASPLNAVIPIMPPSRALHRLTQFGGWWTGVCRWGRTRRSRRRCVRVPWRCC